MDRNNFDQKEALLDLCPAVLYMYAMFALVTLNCSLFSHKFLLVHCLLNKASNPLQDSTEKRLFICLLFAVKLITSSDFS